MSMREFVILGVSFMCTLTPPVPGRSVATLNGQTPAVRPPSQLQKPRPAQPSTAPAPSAPPQSTRQPTATSEEDLKPLVVIIRCKLGGIAKAGAGVILGLGSDRLYIATANHVVRDVLPSGEEIRAEQIEVQLHWLRGEWQPATLLDDYDRTLDVAALAVREASRLAVPQLPWASLVRPDALVAGESVVPVGYPNGIAWFVPRRPHLISSVEQQIILTEGEFTEGNSGGALATEDWGIAGLVRSAGAVLCESPRIDLVAQMFRTWGYPVNATFKEHARTSGSTAGPDAAATLARDRQDAESTVARWAAALLAKDIKTLKSLAATPFYFDNEILVRLEDLEARLLQLFEQRREGQAWQIQSIRATTVGELRAQGADASRDRVLNSLSMLDSDWRVTITVSAPGSSRAEGAVFFVRKIGGEMKVVGSWD